MQSGVDTARARLAAFEPKGETKIDIRPDPSVETAQNQAPQGKNTDFFGADGASFRDVLDAINPLNHIPIVSDIVEAQTGHHVSPVSRMIGGALIGGPIGFVASLASVIFEDATGSTPTQAVYAALTGTTEPATQLARNDISNENAIEQTAESANAEIDHNLEQAEAAPIDPVTTQQLASLAPSAKPANNAVIQAAYTPSVPASKAVLDLYGNSPASAHSSYKKAQLRPYLQDVTTSKVL